MYLFPSFNELMRLVSCIYLAKKVKTVCQLSWDKAGPLSFPWIRSMQKPDIQDVTWVIKRSCLFQKMLTQTKAMCSAIFKQNTKKVIQVAYTV